MVFMQKNVNMFLFVLVLVVAGTLAGSAVYYNENFDKLTNRYDVAAANLSQCHADLENFKFNLNKTLRSLNTTTQDIKRYDELYTTKSEELKTTQSSLEETETSLKQTKVTLQEETTLKNKYKADYQEQLAQTRELEEENTILTAQKAQCETDLRACDTDVEDAEYCITRYLSDYDGDLTAVMKEDLEDCLP